MATDKRQFTLRVQDHVLEGIKMIAQKERRSTAVMIELILEQYLFDYDGFEEDERKKFMEVIFGKRKDT